MREIEVSSPSHLDAEKQRKTDLHSLINVLNIISLQIGELEADFPDHREGFFDLESEIQDLAHGFQVSDDLAPLVQQLRDTEEKILRHLEAVLGVIDFADHRSQLKAAKENFISIYRILNVRLDEFVYRLDQPDIWVEIEANTLSQQMEDVFHAIEKNANGRYYIHFNLALKNKGDYYIDLKIETKAADNNIWMPLRLKDVMRDLLANARKYTEPGGKVALALHQDGDRIRCVVEDSGCGIPEDEIEQVTEFGYRATNVKQYRTMGGGFGLTKAAWLILNWGGQFFIRSGLNEGTRIEIILPNKPRD